MLENAIIFYDNPFVCQVLSVCSDKIRAVFLNFEPFKILGSR